MSTLEEHDAEQAMITAMCEAGTCDHPECHEAPPMRTWTFWVCQADGSGTHHVSAHSAPTYEAARDAALKETAADWGYDPDSELGRDVYAPENLHVLGAVEGDVSIVEWNDDF